MFPCFLNCTFQLILLKFLSKVANGAIIKTHDLCSDVLEVIQGQKFYVQLHVLSLGGRNLVLGTQWLSTLGVTSWDFKLITMPFTYCGHQVLLQGMKAAGSNLQDCDSFFKESLKKGLLVHISVQGSTISSQQSVYPIEMPWVSDLALGQHLSLGQKHHLV